MTTIDHARALLARNAVASGARGAVAATSRTAAAAGAAALGRGGNAVDAALAAALVETVAMPPKCGLAGEVVALVLEPGADVPVSLLALGPAPAALPAVAAGSGLELTGPRSVAVPAAPAGYAALAGRSRFGLAAAVAPAAALAEHGIAWSPLCARLAAQADELLLRWQPDGCVYRPADAPHRVGDVVRLPGLARLLHEFAELGPQLFHGAAGVTVAHHVASLGGVLDADDFRAARAGWGATPSWTRGGTTVWATPAPSYGEALLAAVREVDRGAPVADAVAAAVAVRPGDPAVGALTGGTSVVSAVDADGGAVVLVHSNSLPQFGSGVVVPEYDLVLSNRAGRGFSSDPAASNAIRSGARPATTLHAWMLDAPGRPPLLGATSGGEHQIEWNAQLLTLLLADPGADLGEVVLADRWERAGPDRLRTEDWISDGGGPVGSSHALVRLGSGRRAPTAVSDPRLGGTAIGA